MDLPKAVLVQLGDGKWSDIPIAVAELLGMRRMGLLKALKNDDAFAVTLRDVALDKCAVKVFISASKEEPTNEDETRAGELKGANTLNDIVNGMLTAGLPYLYIRVELPAIGELKT